MTLALDIGTSEFRSLLHRGRRLVGRRCAACYIAVPIDSVTDRWISRMNIPTVRCDDSLIVLGDVAAELSQVLRTPLIPILMNGRVPTSDPIGRQVLSLAIDRVLPEQEESGDALVTIPGDQVDPDSVEVAFLTRLLKARGWKVRMMHSGTATGLAAFADRKYTGLAIDIGAGSSSISILRFGQPLLETTCPVGGRWIDTRLTQMRDRFLYDETGRRYFDMAGMEAWKRTVHLQSDSTRNPEIGVLRDLHWEMARILGSHLEAESATNRHVQALSAGAVVRIGGGGAVMGGFDQILKLALSCLKLPFPLSSIEMIPREDFLVARGLLIAQEVSLPGTLRRVA
jgi:hypothetical protein